MEELCRIGEFPGRGMFRLVYDAAWQQARGAALLATALHRLAFPP